MALQKSYLKAQNQKYCNVTFEQSPEAAKGAKTVHLAGDFNSWSSTETEMKKKKDGSFSVKLKLETGREYQFRYVIDGRWENDWHADKYVPSHYGDFDNSVVIV